MNLTTITDDCLERLARGESVADCLARYPEAADQLAPILSAAEQLRVFSQVRLSQGQRLRAKVALREELAAQQARRERSRRAVGIVGRVRLGVGPLAAMVAVLLFVSVAFTVAASQPGDLVYPVRVAVERAPALVQPDAARRAAVELAVADRRLADLTRDQERDPVAVNALLRGDSAAVERADRLSDSERARVMARVQSHADALGSLASQAKDPQIAARLRNAAERALALAGKSGPVVHGPEWTRTPSPTPPAPTLVPSRALVTASVPKPTAITAAEPSVTPSEPAPTAAATEPSASATPRPRPRLSITPPGIGRTPIVPRPTDGTPWSQGTPRPRPTLSIVPPTRGTVVTPPVVPPTVIVPTIVVPTITVPTITVPTIRVPTIVVPTIVVPTITVPTIVVPTIRVPTFVVPTAPPWMPSSTPGQASVNTPTPTSWSSNPTATVSDPTAAPTATPRPVHTPREIATIVWATFTPRPDIRATLTSTVVVPQRPTQPATSVPTQTPVDGGGPTAIPTDIVQPDATPTPLVSR